MELDGTNPCPPQMCKSNVDNDKTGTRTVTIQSMSYTLLLTDPPVASKLLTQSVSGKPTYLYWQAPQPTHPNQCPADVLELRHHIIPTLEEFRLVHWLSETVGHH